MPMKSKKQRAYLWANDPALAEKFEKHTPANAKLPERVTPKNKRPKRKK